MVIHDFEFGEILVRHYSASRSIKFSIDNSGRLQISAPKFTPSLILRQAINHSREQIRSSLPLRDPATQRARDAKKKLLSKKARDFLPYRLEFLAKKFGYTYSKIRLTHARTRWGSCSSNRTISLNIGLMNLPSELIDYVIIHELAHLNHMDHSAAFWAEVRLNDPKYRTHRQALKAYQPGV